MIGVYKIVNKINGKFYIGSSSDIEYRWRKHKEKLANGKHYNKHLQSSWIEHGEKNFIFEMLEETVIEQLLIREQYYLDKLTPFNEKGYNHCRVAGSPLGNKHSPEAREKISAAGRGRKWSKETRERILNKTRGKKRTPEQKKINSEAQKMRWEKMTEAERNLKKQEVKEHFSGYVRKPSEETKEKIRQALLGRKRPKEVGEKVSKVLKGRKLTEETKQKLRDIAKKRKDDKLLEEEEPQCLTWEI